MSHHCGTRPLQFLAALFVLLSSTVGGAHAQQSYWLREGFSVVADCAGDTVGQPLKAANRDGAWVQLASKLQCRDSGTSFVITIEWLEVSINSRVRDSIEWESLNFDWLGLAVYSGRDGDKEINWIYDEARPLEGRLSKTSSGKIYFGNVSFEIPKSSLQGATHLTFYLTAESAVFPFGLL